MPSDLPAAAITADGAFRRFLLTVHRERPHWNSLQAAAQPIWKSLLEYEQMYAEITKENAESVFGQPDASIQDLLVSLRAKLDIARQDDLNRLSAIVKEMRSVFNAIRNASVQLSYDLLDVNLDAADEVSDSSTASSSSIFLRGSYSGLRTSCQKLVECLCQDVCEADFLLTSLVNHTTCIGVPEELVQNVESCMPREQFTEVSAQLLCPLKCHLELLGVKLDQATKAAKISRSSLGSQQTTPQSHRKSITNK